MSKPILKNIEMEKVVPIQQQVQVLPGQVVSKRLVQNDAVGITMFAFDANEQISTHGSEGDAMVQVLEGEGEFTVGGVKHQVKQGEMLVMPANIPHSVFAPKAFKMLLTVVFPREK